MTKTVLQNKANKILKLLKSYRVIDDFIIDDYQEAINEQKEPIVIMYSDASVQILVGSLDYLYIYPENTVKCSKVVESDKSFQFKSDIFNKVMEV